MTLFDAGDPAPRNPAPREHLSAGRRLTMRQRFDVARGIHPLTRERVNPDGEKRCGNCRFRDPGRYPKCLWRPEGATSGFPFVTSGPATDVRAWVACVQAVGSFCCREGRVVSDFQTTSMRLSDADKVKEQGMVDVPERPTCGRRVYWWDIGITEVCRLHIGHRGHHTDGLWHFDDAGFRVPKDPEDLEP